MPSTKAPRHPSHTLSAVLLAAALLGVTPWAAADLVSALLPNSRSVQINETATVFATVINTGSTLATGCTIAPSTSLNGSFSFATTNPATNQINGQLNEPVSIEPGAAQSFVLSITPSAFMPSTEVTFAFDCDNTEPAPNFVGLNTLAFSASITPVADVIALVATPTADGVSTVSESLNNAAFSVATINLGVTSEIEVSADTGTTDLSVTATVCQTNPTTGACLAPPAAVVNSTIVSNEPASFSVFQSVLGPISFDPANNRLFVRFRQDGVARGATSVAIRSQPFSAEGNYTVTESITASSCSDISVGTEFSYPVFISQTNRELSYFEGQLQLAGTIDGRRLSLEGSRNRSNSGSDCITQETRSASLDVALDAFTLAGSSTVAFDGNNPLACRDLPNCTFDSTLSLQPITLPAVAFSLPSQMDERTSFTTTSSFSRPTEVAGISLVQISGPAAAISNPNSFNATVVVPSLADEASLTFELAVLDVFGNRWVSIEEVRVIPLPVPADFSSIDPVLQSCVRDSAAEDVGLITELECSGVANLQLISNLQQLRRLTLRGNSIRDLSEVTQLRNLEFLDLRDNPALPCEPLIELEEQIGELLSDNNCLATIEFELDDTGHDLLVDPASNLVYVSVPSERSVVVINPLTRRIVDQFVFADEPRGIALSIDGNDLLVALNGAGGFERLNLETRLGAFFDLGTELGHPSTWDVLEVQPGRVFVTSNPSSGGFAYVSQYIEGVGNLRADNDIIRARPTLAVAPDRAFAYVGSGFSPNSLYRFDLAIDEAPITLQDDHGSVSGTDDLVLNRVGSATVQPGARIVTGAGQVLRTGSFSEEGTVSAGALAASNVSDLLYVAPDGDRSIIESYDFSTLERTGTIPHGCNSLNGFNYRLELFPQDLGFALLSGETLCMSVSLPRDQILPEPIDFGVTDRGLRECVEDTASSNDFTRPDQFTSLDCSSRTVRVRELSGLDGFTNLTTLNLSGSSVTSLEDLQSLTQLEALFFADSTLESISAIANLPALTQLDISNSPQINCTEIDALRAASVTVTATDCTQTLRIEVGGPIADLEVDAAEQFAYLSIPSVNRVVKTNLATGAIDQTFQLSGRAQGIDLSADENTLYIAYNGSGDIGYLTLATAAETVVDIATEMDDDRIWDIAELSPNRILVTGNPGSNGFAYVLEVRRDLGNAITRVADQQIIRAAPTIAKTISGDHVYVGAGFSPNSLYKLDATQANLPIIAEDDHGSISGTDFPVVSEDENSVYLTSGQVLNATTLSDGPGSLPAYSALVANSGLLIMVERNRSNDGIATVLDASTFERQAPRSFGCSLDQVEGISTLGTNGVLVAGDYLLCGGTVRPAN